MLTLPENVCDISATVSFHLGKKRQTRRLRFRRDGKGLRQLALFHITSQRGDLIRQHTAALAIFRRGYGKLMRARNLQTGGHVDQLPHQSYAYVHGSDKLVW